MKQEPARKAPPALPGPTPFGMRAMRFARGVFDRAGVRTGSCRPLFLALLDGEGAPAPAPRLALNLTFRLEKLKKARLERGKQPPSAAVERRVLERLFRLELRGRYMRTQKLSVQFPQLRKELRFAVDRTVERYLDFEKTAPGAAEREMERIRRRAEKILVENIDLAASALPSAVRARRTDVTRFHRASVSRAEGPHAFSRAAWNPGSRPPAGGKRPLSRFPRFWLNSALSIGRSAASWPGGRTPPGPPRQEFWARRGAGILPPEAMRMPWEAARARPGEFPAWEGDMTGAALGRERRFLQTLERLIAQIPRAGRTVAARRERRVPDGVPPKEARTERLEGRGLAHTAREAERFAPEDGIPKAVPPGSSARSGRKAAIRRDIALSRRPQSVPPRASERKTRYDGRGAPDARGSSPPDAPGKTGPVFSRPELTFLRPPAFPEREAAADGGDGAALPPWALELLRKPSFAGAAERPPRFGGERLQMPAPDMASGAARGGRIYWSAPDAARPAQSVSMFQTRLPDAAPPPAAIEWKRRGESGTAGAPRPFSEAELRRTADRVYALIEERLRRELRRSGR